MKPGSAQRGAFTLIELLVVIAIIGILAAMLLPGLARAKESARRIFCLNSMRQLGLSFQMYTDENDGCLPPRTHPNRWPERLRPGYKDLKILVCPTDGLRPQTIETDSNRWPADAAPRSYIYNAWNDFYLNYYGRADWRRIAATNDFSIKENNIREPSATLVFGEKDENSQHYYFDYETFEDVTQLDQSRHSGGRKGGDFDGGGGANYTFADGSARFLKFGRCASPINMWAVLPQYRNLSVPMTVP